MNFTREPIIETIISSKEGNKLRIKSTKNIEAKEYLVDAVEVVSFGSAFFYRSLEPGNVFFVPSQDFEIVQVRQARLLLKTPEEKAIKIAGGSEAGKKKSSEKSKEPSRKKAVKDSKRADKEKNKSSNDSKTQEKKISEKDKKTEETKQPKQDTPSKEKPSVKKITKKVQQKKTKSVDDKKSNKERKSKEKKEIEEDINPSLFNHLLRPPEGLISDSISKYQKDFEEESEDIKRILSSPEDKTTNNQKENVVDEVNGKNLIDDPNLVSEPPKPFEKLEETEEKPLSLKERMKKVLSPLPKEKQTVEEKE